MTTRETVMEVEEAAARWILKRDSGQWTDTDQKQLDSWLEASVRHRVSFVRLNAVWGDVAALEGTDVERAPGWDLHSEEHSRRRWRPSLGQGVAIAAGIVLVLGVTLVLVATPDPGVVYSTDIGGHKAVPIADGSVISLNTDTQIRVQLSESERRMTLLRGEAFFQVKADPKRPFTVRVGSEQIAVIGTEFSVWEQPAQLHVAVVSGEVRIGGEADAVILTAGKVADIDRLRIRVKSQPVQDIHSELEWRSGRIAFRNTPLPEAIGQFNRYRTQKIFLEDPSLATVTIIGDFVLDDVESFLKELRHIGVRSQIQGDRIVLTRGS